MKTCVLLCALFQTIHFGEANENLNYDSQEGGTLTALWNKIRELEERDREFDRKCGDTEILKARLAHVERQLKNMQGLEYRLRKAEEQIQMFENRLENKNINNLSTLEIVNAKLSHDTINSSAPIKVESDVSSINSMQNETDYTINENVSFKNRINTAIKLNGIGKEKRTITRRAAFTAMISSTIVSVTPGRLLQFDRVDYNEGNAYDVKTGIFTCPISGTYFFFTNILSMHHTEPIATELVFEGQGKGRAHAVDKENHNQGSTAASLHCDAGQRVWVQVAYGLQFHGLSYSSFSGFLLWQDDAATNSN